MMNKELDMYDLAECIVAEGDTLRKTKDGWDNGTALLGPVTSRGLQRWRFRIERGVKASVGVALDDVRLSTYLNESASGWGWYQGNGNIGHAGPAQTPYSEGFKEAGSEVIVELDADRGTLRFYRDGVDQGIAFPDLPRDGHFVCGVTLYGEGDSIQFVQPDDSASHVLRCSREISIEKDPSTGRCQLRKAKNGWQNGTVLVGPVTTRGVVRWRYRIDRGIKASVGVALNGISIETYLNETASGWGWYQGNGNIGHAGPAQTSFSEGFKNVGSEVTVELDADAGTLRFYRNGVDQGIAFDDLPRGGHFVGGVTLYGAGDVVTVLDSSEGGDGGSSSEGVVSPEQLLAQAALDSLPLRMKASAVQLSADDAAAGALVLRKMEDGWQNGTALLGPLVTRGVVSWDFRIERGVKASIGVALDNVQLDTYLNETKSGWGWYQGNGNIGHAGPAQTPYSEGFKEAGTEVTVELDTDRGTLRFYRDGVDQGIAFSDLPRGKSFVGAVTLYGAGDVARLVAIRCENLSIVSPSSVIFACPMTASRSMRDLAAGHRRAGSTLPTPPQPPRRGGRVATSAWPAPQICTPLALEDFELEAWIASLGAQADVRVALVQTMMESGFDAAVSLATLSADDLTRMGVTPRQIRLLRPGIEQLRRDLSDAMKEDQRKVFVNREAREIERAERDLLRVGMKTEWSSSGSEEEEEEKGSSSSSSSSNVVGGEHAEKMLGDGQLGVKSVDRKMIPSQDTSLLNFETLLGERFRLNTDLVGTVDALKRQIRAVRGAAFPHEKLILVHSGHRLDDASILTACAIGSGATLQLIVRE